MITGVHHVCVKCRPEELEKVQKFYGELLGLPLVRSWGEPNVEGLMYGAGTSLIEIFPNAEEDLPKPSLPARIAFIIGPVGEEIELFCEKQ